MDVFLTDDAGVLEREGEAKHDEVGICSVKTVGVIREEGVLVGPDELHNLMLSLSRSVRSSEHNGESLPVLVLLNLLQQEEVDHLVQLLHEAGAWRNRVVLEVLLAVGNVRVAVQLL